LNFRAKRPFNYENVRCPAGGRYVCATPVRYQQASSLIGTLRYIHVDGLLFWRGGWPLVQVFKKSWKWLKAVPIRPPVSSSGSRSRQTLGVAIFYPAFLLSMRVLKAGQGKYGNVRCTLSFGKNWSMLLTTRYNFLTSTFLSQLHATPNSTTALFQSDSSLLCGSIQSLAPRGLDQFHYVPEPLRVFFAV
jgi:hypothetical protein